MYIHTQVKLKCVHASFESALNNEDISSYIDAYAKFRHDARTGHLGKTAQLLGVIHGSHVARFTTD